MGRRTNDLHREKKIKKEKRKKKSDNKLKTNLGRKKKKPRKPTDFKTTNIVIVHARNNSEL